MCAEASILALLRASALCHNMQGVALSKGECVKNISVKCPVCPKIFYIKGGLSTIKVENGLIESGTLEKGDLTVCTDCYSPLQFVGEALWVDASTPEVWLSLSLDDQTLMKNLQAMVKNRKAPDDDKKYKGAIGVQLMNGEPHNEAQEKAALIQVALTVAIGILKKKIKNDKEFAEYAMEAIKEISQVAHIGIDEFHVKTKIMIATTIALSIVEGEGSLEKAIVDLERALKVAERDSKRTGVKVMNMSEQIPNEQTAD